MKLYFQLEYLAKLSPKPVHNIAYNTGEHLLTFKKIISHQTMN